MIRSIFLTLKRIFSEKSYWLCCVCVFGLCFTASVGTAGNGDPLNVLSYIFGDEKNPPGAESVVNLRGGSWLFMFMPIVSVLCFVNVICDDKKSRFLRCEIFRTGYYKFKAAKYLSSAISSGTATLLGFAAYTAFIILYFPRDEFAEINLAVILTEMFIYGIMSAVPALITAAFTNNKYLIACIPFLLKYCLSQLALQLSLDAYEDMWNPNLTLVKIGKIINPDSVNSVFSFSYSERLGVILINAFILFGGFAAYLFKKGGVDKGE